MASKRDYYEVLSVDKSASNDEIKKAYRKQAIKYHPDKNQGDKASEDKFKEATEAYEILSDDKKRSQYDRFGHQGVHSDFADAYGRSGGFNTSDFESVFGGNGGGFDDIFSSLFGFGGGSSRGRTKKGNDIRYDITLTLEEVALGKKTDIEIKKRDTCDVCSGSGAEPGSKKSTCNTCGGHGQVRRAQGFFSITQTCPTCQGSGTIISNPCKSCKGEGTKVKSKKISVNIPEGVDDNTQLRVTGEGEAVGGGNPGDLYLFISIKPHQHFVREAINLFVEIPINIVQATLGDEVSIKTLDNKTVKIKIPAGTITGTIFRVRGSGIPHINRPSSKGDLFVIVTVETPTSLSSEEKKLFNELKKVSENNSTPAPKKPSKVNW